jgi:hypothetical protein
MNIFGNILAVEKAHACPYLATQMYQEGFTSLTTAMTGIISSVTYPQPGSDPVNLHHQKGRPSHKLPSINNSVYW